MKRKVIIALCSVILSACGTGVAMMDKSMNVKSQPELPIKTNGDFWGFGREGTFDLAGKYNGQYSRDASNSNWFFGRITIKDGSLVASVNRTDNQQKWQLVCSGGGTGVHYMGVDFGGNDPYSCRITQNDREVGEYIMEPSAGMIDLSMEKKEKGFIRIGSTHFNIETVHTGEGLLMAVEKPLGYSFKQGSQEVAATQTNGMLTLQMLPELSEAQKDTIVVGTIASALSWRPEE